MNSFYTQEEIIKLGFKKTGKNLYISRNAKFYGIENISIGNNVRIDDFCILSGRIKIGSYVHISAYCAFYGSKGIKIGDFSGTSPRTIIFSAVDDFSGAYLINPMIPSEYTNIKSGKVIINDYVQLGANTIVMPNITINEGAVTGAFAFVNKDLDSWFIYAGIPAKVLKERKKDLLKYAKRIKEKIKS